ncbi:hypothetical protein [Frankia sp. QA3]|uniref:hypothetical protein n=1 Tax=Frankia sp. QA3 TaxID=710111 RepID=UPI000269C6F8|nr:hypothetical protein [Frankia sp. QA3]EIV94043.1 hypothetical protein FraQA3DRAFT_3774 [Frankia sp. QA3]
MTRAVSVIVRRDGVSWSAWSPQCPGLAIAEPTATELRSAFPDALAWYFDGNRDLDMQIHLEQELRGVVIRIAQDTQVWERQLVAGRLGAALGVDSQAAELRSAALNAAGEIVYVCALPSDPVSWLTAQMDDETDAVVVTLPSAESMLWTLQFGTVGSRGEKPSSLRYRPETTFGEIMPTFAGPRLRLSA